MLYAVSAALLSLAVRGAFQTDCSETRLEFADEESNPAVKTCIYYDDSQSASSSAESSEEETDPLKDIVFFSYDASYHIDGVASFPTSHNTFRDLRICTGNGGTTPQEGDVVVDADDAWWHEPEVPDAMEDRTAIKGLLWTYFYVQGQGSGYSPHIYFLNYQDFKSEVPPAQCVANAYNDGTQKVVTEETFNRCQDLPSGDMQPENVISTGGNCVPSMGNHQFSPQFQLGMPWIGNYDGVIKFTNTLFSNPYSTFVWLPTARAACCEGCDTCGGSGSECPAYCTGCTVSTLFDKVCYQTCEPMPWNANQVFVKAGNYPTQTCYQYTTDKRFRQAWTDFKWFPAA